MVDGMRISYTGDGDRALGEPDFNDGNTNSTTEQVLIDKTTEPVFLMVSGQGVFNVKVSWDKMPEIPGIEINKAGIKNIINYTGAADEIKFPITGKNVVTGNPQYFTRVDFPDGSYINDIRMNYDSTTGYGGYSTANYYGPYLLETGYNSAIKGLEEAMLTLREGSSVRLIIPSWLSDSIS